MTDIVESIQNLIIKKIDFGKELNITHKDVENMDYIYADDNGNIGKIMLTTWFINKLSPETQKEIYAMIAAS